MKFKDSVDKYISFSEGEYYDDADDMDYGYEDEDEETFEEAPAKKSRSSKGFFDNLRSRASKVMPAKKADDYSDYDEGYEDDYYEDEPQPRKSGSANVVDFNSKSRPGSTKVILAKPSMFDSETAKGIARNINKQCLVLLNLEMVSDPDVRRMIDFLSGVVFANDGKINCISHKTFIILPHNYDFSGDVLENLKNGYYSI